MVLTFLYYSKASYITTKMTLFFMKQLHYRERILPVGNLQNFYIGL